MSQENVDLVQRAFEAWNRGDIEGYLAMAWKTHKAESGPEAAFS
jgi:ketosteroid isomerase-like protein